MVRIDWNTEGFEEVRRFKKVQESIEWYAENIARAAGRGFVASARHGRTRYRAIVYPETFSAMYRNKKTNALVKALRMADRDS